MRSARLTVVLLVSFIEYCHTWLHPRFHLSRKPQMLDALQYAQPTCPQGLVVDVGANGGKETNAAAAYGYHVLSIECLKAEFMRLEAGWKGSDKITLLNGCASDKLSLQTFHEASASSSLHAEAVSSGPERAKARRGGNRVKRTLTFPLDPIIEGYGGMRVCVIKIDTQGHELMVMKGLRSSITTHRPVVIFEYDPRFGPLVNLTVPWMQELSYDCAIPVVGKPHGDCQVCNVLCMPTPTMWNARLNASFDVPTDGMALQKAGQGPGHGKKHANHGKSTGRTRR